MQKECEGNFKMMSTTKRTKHKKKTNEAQRKPKRKRNTKQYETVPSMNNFFK